MIVVGFDKEWKPCEDRDRMFSMGGIMAVLDDDVVDTIWAGRGEGRDFVMVRARGRDATYLMGRIRIHVDDKMHNSEDEKEVLQVAMDNELAAEDEEKMVSLCSGIVGLAHGMGIEETVQMNVEIPGGEFPESFTKILGAIPGWETSVTTEHAPGGSS